MKAQCMIKKRAFSLLEVGVVTALLAATGSLFMFTLIPFYHTHRFHRECQGVYELIKNLQINALLYQSDMQLHVYQEKGRWMARSESEEILLKSELIKLPYIHHITYGSCVDHPFTLCFYANGRINFDQRVIFSYKQEQYTVSFEHPCLIFDHVPFPSSSTQMSLEEKIRQIEAIKLPPTPS
ncbi:MAG: type II secretion system protein [Candidatus Rhabdochlamydia sp.]